VPQFRPALLAILTLTACSLPAGAAGQGDVSSSPAPDRRSAVLLSIDALSERRLRESLPADAIPTLLSLFERGACAASVVPAFPSATAAGHAALWTGAYGDVNGIAGNLQPQLPRAEHTLLQLGSGFFAGPLRAEPIWITARRAGLSVASHHGTQAPQPPGYTAHDGPDANGARRRAEAEWILRSPGIFVANGYNRLHAPARVITEASAPPRPARGWEGLEALRSGVPPLELAWPVGADSAFALLHGRDRYSEVLLAPARRLDLAVGVEVAPVDMTPVPGRALARHFSEPVRLRSREGVLLLRLRAFHLAPDAGTFRFFHPSIHVVEANDDERLEAYLQAIGGWSGNAAIDLLRQGAFGTALADGGDGSAERYYLETAEYLTRQYMRGVEWLVENEAPRLLIDYFPLGDELDHELHGLIDPRSPRYTPESAARAQAVRARGWRLVDMRLAHLQGLVAATPGAALFVSGDHGMRATWRVFRPNLALRDAGLLALDGAGAIDLSRTLALSPNGNWVAVNREAWKEGIVPPAAAAEVIRRAERALLAARDAEGKPVVTRIWRPSEGLGMGGSEAGDLYFSVAEGFHFTASVRGEVTGPARPEGKHGYPSPEPDMHTAFCVVGPAVRPGRIGVVQLIDVAPTVAEWLRIPPPRDARGRSALAELLGAGAGGTGSPAAPRDPHRTARQ
jgi:hypothetical protein